MKEVVLFIAASIDGFIARNDGDTSWLHDERYMIPNEDFGYQQFCDSIGTVIMGNNTYKVIRGFDIPYPYAEMDNYVFSKSKQGKDEYCTYISENLPGFVQGLKQQEGKDIWLIGGGEISGMLLQEGLIDKIILTIIPCTLGEGVRLFAPHNAENHFKLLDSTTYSNGMTTLTYKVEF